MRLSRLTVLLALLPAALAFAETDQERQAREDFDKQLKAMVGTPPMKIRIEFVGLDQPNYELTEASFKLDGRNLPITNLKKLNSEGDHLIFHGDVQPGEHRLESKFEFLNKTSQVVSSEGGFKWKPGSEVSFRTESGIQVQIKVTPELNMSGDIKNRIMVKSPATVKMLAKLDDGSMPPMPDRPNLAIAEVDAGVADAGVVVVKGETAAQKAAALAEAKKKAREEAAAAKKAAAEEKKRLADEAKAARLAAAADKKRAAEDAKAAKLAAAEEKKRAAAEALAAKNNKVAANDTTKTTDPVVPAPAEVDAGAPEVAVAEVDAGPVVVAVAPVPTPVKPVEAAPVEEEGGLPLPVWIAIGVAVLGLLLFLAARRKKS